MQVLSTLLPTTPGAYPTETEMDTETGQAEVHSQIPASLPALTPETELSRLRLLHSRALGTLMPQMRPPAPLLLHSPKDPSPPSLLQDFLALVHHSLLSVTAAIILAFSFHRHPPDLLGSQTLTSSLDPVLSTAQLSSHEPTQCYSVEIQCNSVI